VKQKTNYVILDYGNHVAYTGNRIPYSYNPMNDQTFTFPIYLRLS